MSTPNTFGERIAYLRTKQNKTQAAFAEAIGLSPDSRTTVAKWEHGSTFPPCQSIPDLCSVLNCDVGYLFGEFDTPRRETTDIAKETGLSASAVERLRSLKNDPYCTEFLSSIITSKYFSDILENLSKAVECRNSSLARFQGQYADDMKELFDKMGVETKEYVPHKTLTVDDSTFDQSILMLANISPSMTALSRADAAKFHLREAERSFRLAAEDAIDK